MITYKVTLCKGLSTYGIIATGSDGVIDEIPDISADREAVYELAELMNREQLSLVHFRDAIEDFLVRVY
ncbi:MAG: DUF6514 family protein [Oscillospiraceae bacterium]|nr:DUF6514 family protein [Ruminococcus sp.]MCD8344615.1 DUF6514 family protein [Oscillospiraceae bacterium]